jgi:hypothetical protein
MDRVETRRHERWTEVGVAMCNVSFEDQQRFEQAFLELRNDVKAGKRPPTDVVHLVNGPPQRRDHFVGSLVRSADPATRAKFYEQAARTAMAASNAQRIIEIAIVPEPQPEPYFALTVFDHGRDDEPEPNPVGADGGFEHRH